jgi:multidrug resistance efflux pump
MIAGLKSIAVALGLVIVLVPAGYYAWRWYDRSRDIQATNDAYVRGEITDLSSRVSGYAVELLLDDGMPVKATDVLVRIDPRDFRMGVEKAEAALNQAKADLAAVVASRELGKSKVARPFTVRLRFNARDANAALARPGMSVETAIAVSTSDNASPNERGNRLGCSFDPSKGHGRAIPDQTTRASWIGSRSSRGLFRHTDSRAGGTLALKIPAVGGCPATAVRRPRYRIRS